MFESIQVEEKNPDLFTVPLSGADRLVNPVVQQHAIGQTSQEVVLRRMSDLQRHGPGLADVAENDYRARSVPFSVVDGSDGVFDRNFKFITPDENAVRRQ